MSSFFRVRQSGATATKWSEDELQSGKIGDLYEEVLATDAGAGLDAKTAYNNRPGTGITGYSDIPPNNYPFYTEEEKYKPLIQNDGGILSDWKPLYNPTPEQAEEDRQKAYETGVPHGYVPDGDKYANDEKITITVKSLLHDDSEYGEKVDKRTNKHFGGQFKLEASPNMRVHELRKLIRDKGGIAPGLQKLSFAGKNLEDSQRTLEQYGIKYWNAKFPDWPLIIRRF